EATCFTLDLDQCHHLVTAAHVVGTMQSPGKVFIFHDSQWKPLDVQFVGKSDAETDVAVLVSAAPLSPAAPLPPGNNQMFLGMGAVMLLAIKSSVRRRSARSEPKR